jgi:H+/Cl- antiporter ClcA
MGALFNYCVKGFFHLRDRLGLSGYRRYVMLAIVALITSLLSFPMDPLLKNSMDNTVNKLFAMDSLTFASPSSTFAHLVLFIIIKFILSAISIIQPISSGVFMPVFATGAGVGRLMGEIIHLFRGVTPGGYSVVGAAALASGCTRTLSTSVIMFELTGQLSYMVPIMIATVTATAVGNLFNMSIYDEILTLRGLPYLTQIRDTSSVVNKSVHDLMRERKLQVLYVQSDDHIGDIKKGMLFLC